MLNHRLGFLKLDTSALPKSLMPFRWVGNLPYNVSVPILLQLAEWVDWVEDGHFLVQKKWHSGAVLRLANATTVV